jgi:hypothetical protein
MGAGARQLAVVPPLLKFELDSLDPVNGISTCTVVEALVNALISVLPCVDGMRDLKEDVYSWDTCI